jgi:hypothetical protein
MSYLVYPQPVRVVSPLYISCSDVSCTQDTIPGELHEQNMNYDNMDKNMDVDANALSTTITYEPPKPLKIVRITNTRIVSVSDSNFKIVYTRKTCSVKKISLRL